MNSAVDDLRERVCGERGLQALDLYLSGDVLVLSRIAVAPDFRGHGLADAALEDICRFADEHGLDVALTPSGDFGASVPRLNRWYKQHGFVENKGRSRDFRTRETMIRRAR